MPYAYTSLLSVNRPMVVYSGARYPFVALAFTVEKKISSASSMGAINWKASIREHNTSSSGCWNVQKVNAWGLRPTILKHTLPKLADLLEN
ncbi:hypothetical protein AgCh_000893 [Apium graveolens]